MFVITKPTSNIYQRFKASFKTLSNIDGAKPMLCLLTEQDSVHTRFFILQFLFFLKATKYTLFLTYVN